MAVVVKDAAKTGGGSKNIAAADGAVGTQRTFDDKVMEWQEDEVDPHITTMGRKYLPASISGPAAGERKPGHEITDGTPVAPFFAGTVAITGVEAVGQTLTGHTGSPQGTPDPTETYEWRRTGVAIAGATGLTYILQAADLGETITFYVHLENTEGTDEDESDPTGAIGELPSFGGTVAITGTPTFGETLTGDDGAPHDGAPAPTPTYEWLRDDVPIAGATMDTYDLVEADIGAVIKFRVTLTNTHGNTSSTSAGTAAVAGIAPSFGGTVTISGTPEVGETLTGGTGTPHNGTPAPTPTYRWLRNDVPISGATATTYELVALDDGAEIKFEVTLTNSEDVDVETSDPVTIGSDDYAANGFSPPVVADFINEYYRAGDVETDFNTLFGTPTRSSLATMVNSAGKMVFNRHNVIENTDDLTQWVLTGATLSVDTITEDTSTGEHSIAPGVDTSLTNAVIIADVIVTGRSWVQIKWRDATGNRTAFFNVSTHTVGTVHASVVYSDVIDLGGGVARCILQVPLANSRSAVSDGGEIALASADNTASYTGDGSSTMQIVRYGSYSELATITSTPTDNEWYVENAGTSSTYLPRRGNHVYNGSTWANQGIGHETSARTNLIANSNSNTGKTIGANGTSTQNAVDPWGNANTAFTLADDSGGGTGLVSVAQLNNTVSTATTYTWSAFFKKSGVDYVAMRTFNFTTPGNNSSFFNLATGAVVSTGTGHTARIIDYGGGWFRCSITFTTDASDTQGDLYAYASQDGTSLTVDRDGTTSILWYGYQFEAGAFPSSYMPTNGATVTRTADSALTIDTALLDFPGTSGAVSMKCSGVHQGFDLDTAIRWNSYEWNLNGSNLIRQYNSDNISPPRSYFSQEALNVFDQIFINNDLTAANAAFNVAGRHGATVVNGAVNGTAGTADTTPTALPDLSATDLKVCSGANDAFFGTVGVFAQWNVDIGDAGIEEATS